MKSFALRCLLLWALLGGGAQAQTGDDTLYRALGAREGIGTLMVDFVGRLRADPRIGALFKETNPQYLAEQLRDQICGVAGGPCEYEGPTMKKAHEDMKIGKADFNALVEVLQQAMDARNVPFGVQNQLLARLAPMHRDIVNAP